MKEIKLSQRSRKNKGQFVALVDDENYDYLNQWKWYISRAREPRYPVRSAQDISGQSIKITMHSLIMGVKYEYQIDHIDGNGLNCQKFNMRFCTISENNRNRKGTSNTGFKGVHLSHNSIYACIYVNKEHIYLGTFGTFRAAALAYNRAAVKYHGEFANLNKL
jgi:hypothetical protein